MARSEVKMDYDRRVAGKDADRLKAIQTELRAISKRLEELAEEAVFSEETKRALPKEYRSKSTWAGFEKTPQDLNRAATSVYSVASGMQMGINLADVAEKA